MNVNESNLPPLSTLFIPQLLDVAKIKKITLYCFLREKNLLIKPRLNTKVKFKSRVSVNAEESAVNL